MVMSFILIPSNSIHSVSFIRVCRIVDVILSVALQISQVSLNSVLKVSTSEWTTYFRSLRSICSYTLGLVTNISKNYQNLRKTASTKNF